MSYDHRIIDGREAVMGLVAMKEALEDPSRLLFDHLKPRYGLKQACLTGRSIGCYPTTMSESPFMHVPEADPSGRNEPLEFL